MKREVIVLKWWLSEVCRRQCHLSYRHNAGYYNCSCLSRLPVCTGFVFLYLCMLGNLQDFQVLVFLRSSQKTQWYCYHYHHHHHHHNAVGQVFPKDQISCVETPVFKVMVLWMDSSELIVYWQQQCSYEKDPREISYPSAAWEHSQRTSVCGPGSVLTRHRSCQLRGDLRLSRSQTCDTGSFVAHSPPAYSVLQWSPKWTGQCLQGYLAFWHGIWCGYLHNLCFWGVEPTYKIKS